MGDCCVTYFYHGEYPYHYVGCLFPCDTVLSDYSFGCSSLCIDWVNTGVYLWLRGFLLPQSSEEVSVYRSERLLQPLPWIGLTSGYNCLPVYGRHRGLFRRLGKRSLGP